MSPPDWRRFMSNCQLNSKRRMQGFKRLSLPLTWLGQKVRWSKEVKNLATTINRILGKKYNSAECCQKHHRHSNVKLSRHPWGYLCQHLPANPKVRNCDTAWRPQNRICPQRCRQIHQMMFRCISAERRRKKGSANCTSQEGEQCLRRKFHLKNRGDELPI